MASSEKTEDRISEEDLNLLLESEGIDLDDELEEDDFESGFEGSDQKAEQNQAQSEPNDELEEDEPEGEEDEEVKEDVSEPASQEEPISTVTISKKEYDGLQSRVRNIEGRFGTMNAQMQKMLDAQKSVQSSGGDAPSSQQINSAKISSEKFKRLKEDFPEWAEAMEEELNLRTENIKSSIPRAPDLNNYISRDDAQDLVGESRKLAYLDLKYSNWENEVRTNDFRMWYLSQDDNMKALADSTDVNDSAKMLEAYFSFRHESENNTQNRELEKMNVVKQKNQKRLESGISPTKSSAALSKRTSSEEEDFEEGFNS